MIPVYVISLTRALDRRADITRRLNAAGIDYEIIDAVDGNQLDLSTLKNRLRQDKFRAKYDRDMKRGEIGCFLSHYNLWQRIVKEQTPFALVLEDDAEWDDDFFATVRDVLQSKYYWNVVHLTKKPNAWRINSVLETVGNNRKLARYKYPMGGAVAYLIDLDGAKKLLPHCSEITALVDAQWLNYWQCNLYFYHVQPSPVRNAAGDSFIGAPTPEKSKHQLRAEMGRWRYFINANRKRYARRWYHWTHPPKRRQR